MSRTHCSPSLPVLPVLPVLLLLPLIVLLVALGMARAGDGDPAMDAYRAGDYDTARRQLEPRAEAGDPEAQLMLGVMYQSGRGVSRDPATAAKWYRKAAQQGDDRAQNNLGVLLRDGDGVKRDPGEASRWFTKAARAGNPEAQNSLGALLSSGADGVTRDPVEAAAWFTLASAGGVEAAAKNRTALLARMTPEEAVTADRRASELQRDTVASAVRRRPIASGASEPAEATPARASFGRDGTVVVERDATAGPRTVRVGERGIAVVEPTTPVIVERTAPVIVERAPPVVVERTTTPVIVERTPPPIETNGVRPEIGPVGSFEEIAAVDAGRVLRLSIRAASAAEGLSQALRVLGARFDERPRALVCFSDTGGGEVQAIFEAKDRGAIVRGLAIATATPGEPVTVLVMHDAADRFAASHERLAAEAAKALPMRDAAGHELLAREQRSREALERSSTAWSHVIRDTWPTSTEPGGDRVTLDTTAIDESVVTLNHAAGEERYRRVAYAELNR